MHILHTLCNFCTVVVSVESMKLKRNEVKKLAEFLGWDIPSTKKALEFFRELEFPLDHDDFLRICLNASSKEKRSTNLYKFVLINIKGNDVEKLATIIKHRDIIDIYLFFNIVDGFKEQGHEVNLEYNRTTDPLIFPHFTILSDELKDSKGHVLYQSFDLYSDAPKTENDRGKILNKIFGYMVRVRERKYQQRTIHSFMSAAEDMIIDLASHCGFKIFEIPYIREYLPERDGYFIDPNFPIRFMESINNYPLLNRSNITKRHYILIYCLVEKIKEEFGTLESLRKAAMLLNSSRGTIHARYYQMKRELKNSKNSLDNIINKNGLDKAINSYLNHLNNI